MMCSVPIEGLKEGCMLHQPHQLCQNSVLVRLYHSQVLELTAGLLYIGTYGLTKSKRYGFVYIPVVSPEQLVWIWFLTCLLKPSFVVSKHFVLEGECSRTWVGIDDIEIFCYNNHPL